VAEFMGPLSSIKFDTDIPIPMRDGVKLYADIYRPDGRGKLPVILLRTPYNKNLSTNRFGSIDPLRASSHGYAVVIQDTRGRYTSQGEFYPFIHEIEDGYDTVEWCAAQPWSSGKVGMTGASYVGSTQWMAAVARPPSLKAIAPQVTSSDHYEGWTYQGGAMCWAFTMSWAMRALTLANFPRWSQGKTVPPGSRSKLLNAINNMSDAMNFIPLKDFPYLQGGLAPFFYDWIRHPRLDSYWKRVRTEEHWGQMDLPALNIGGWYDLFAKGTLRNFVGMSSQTPSERARKGQRLLMGPWNHIGGMGSVSGDFFFGIQSSKEALDRDGMLLRWFDHWLRDQDTGVDTDPPVRIFVMGENVWRDEQEWPLERTQFTDYFFHSEGNANTLNGDGTLGPHLPGAEPPDTYQYDPLNPVPCPNRETLVGSAEYAHPGTYDQREIEMRQDVLVYSTPPLQVDLEVTGPVTVVLHAVTSAEDTDFTGKLVDVSPAGTAMNLTEGILRARYRDTTEHASLIQPRDIYEYKIDLVSTSNLFRKGHRIRVEISSSNFPRFDRNLNTALEPWEESQPRTAVQTVFHSAEYPSRIILPIIPR
jgi:putative CocE/NonD family hydrolase